MAGHWQHHLPRLATACLSATAIYIVVMVMASRLAEAQVTAWLTERDDVPIEVMSAPVPANPFRRDIVVVDTEHYHFLELDWLRAEPIQIASPSIGRGTEAPVTEAALNAPNVWGLAEWTRFPAFVVKETEDGYRVSISDIRYARRVGDGLGAVVVELDRNLNVR